jgi:hypothetical protein
VENKDEACLSIGKLYAEYRHQLQALYGVVKKDKRKQVQSVYQKDSCCFGTIPASMAPATGNLSSGQSITDFMLLVIVRSRFRGTVPVFQGNNGSYPYPPALA